MRVIVAAIIVLGAFAATARAEPCADDERYDRPQQQRSQRPGPRAADFLGKTPAKLVAAFGEPVCKSARKWRYFRPDGCAYERHVVTLWFAAGKVARVNIVHVWTGEECAYDQRTSGDHESGASSHSQSRARVAAT